MIKPNPFKKAILHARETARRGGSVSDCGYKHGAWRSVWLSTFEHAQQLNLPLVADRSPPVKD